MTAVFRAGAGFQRGGDGQGLLVTVPAAVQVGDHGVLVTIIADSLAVPPSMPGWDIVVPVVTVPTGGHQMAVFYRQRQAGDPATIDASWSGIPTSGNNTSVLAGWWSGPVTGASAGVVASSSTATNTRVCPSLTTGGPDRTVVTISTSQGKSTGFPSSVALTPNATLRATQYATGNFYGAIALGDFNQAAAGSTPVQTATWNWTVDRSLGVQVELTEVAANQPPVAYPGADQTVEPWSLVALAGSGTDSDGTIKTYAWRQTAGAAVTLTGSGANRTFTAPASMVQQTLVFELTVTDNGGLTNSAQTEVVVLPATEAVRSGGVWSPRFPTRRSGGSWSVPPPAPPPSQLQVDRIAYLGDSLTDQDGTTKVATSLGTLGWSSSQRKVSGHVGRPIVGTNALTTAAQTSQAVIAGWRGEGWKPRVWVLALGANNIFLSQSSWTADMNTLLDLIALDGTGQTVYIVGQVFQKASENAGSTYAGMEPTMQTRWNDIATARQGSGMTVVPIDLAALWRGYFNGGSESGYWSGGDGRHMTGIGYNLRNTLIGSVIGVEAP